MRCNFYLLRLKSVKQVEKQLSVKQRKMLKIVPINVTVNELHLLKKLKENLLKAENSVQRNHGSQSHATFTNQCTKLTDFQNFFHTIN